MATVLHGCGKDVLLAWREEFPISLTYHIRMISPLAGRDAEARGGTYAGVDRYVGGPRHSRPAGGLVGDADTAAEPRRSIIGAGEAEWRCILNVAVCQSIGT